MTFDSSLRTCPVSAERCCTVSFSPGGIATELRACVHSVPNLAPNGELRETASLVYGLRLQHGPPHLPFESAPSRDASLQLEPAPCRACHLAIPTVAKANSEASAEKRKPPPIPLQRARTGHREYLQIPMATTSRPQTGDTPDRYVGRT